MVNPTLKYKTVIFISVALNLTIGVCQTAESAEKSMRYFEKCKYWQAKVDPSILLSKDTEISSALTFEISEEEASSVLEAAECLLKLKGKTSSSKFSATVGYNLSTRFPPPTVEVAALYYISSLYYKNWRHAQAIILMDKAGRKNTKKSIKTAYKAYQTWFEKVKEIGLERAREQNLDPLDGTDLRWY